MSVEPLEYLLGQPAGRRPFRRPAEVPEPREDEVRRLGDPPVLAALAVHEIDEAVASDAPFVPERDGTRHRADEVVAGQLPELPQVLVPEASFDWYQPGEAARLIESAANEWERAVLMFPLHTGARMGEQRAIRWSDVDFALQRIHIRQSAPKWLDEEKAPKSNRHRWVDLTPELAAALRSIRGEGQLVFYKSDGGKLSPGQFREILAAAQRRSGLRRIKWHELRHSFASILTTGGAPLRIVQSLLGHSSIRMTERYAHLAPGQSAAFAHLLSAAAPPPRSTDDPASGPQLGPRPPSPLN